MPRVTVLLPVRDAADSVMRAIDSILQQDWQDLQLLVLDDGSVDGSGDVAMGVNDDRILVHRSERPMGLASTLNRGLDLSDSEFVARMDADDWSHPARLTAQIAYMTEHQDIAACSTAVTAIRPDGSRRLWRYPADHDAIRASLLFENVLAHPASMMRRGTLHSLDLRYDPTFEKSQDYDLWERLGRHARLGNLCRSYLEYNVSPADGGASAVRQKILADRVRLRQLQDLGLEVDEQGLLLHSAISRWQTDAIPLEDIIAWLQKLLRANADCGLYDQAALADVVTERLFRAARQAVLRDPQALRQYRHSGLRGHGLQWIWREWLAALRAWRYRVTAGGDRHDPV